MEYETRREKFKRKIALKFFRKARKALKELDNYISKNSDCYVNFSPRTPQRINEVTDDLEITIEEF